MFAVHFVSFIKLVRMRVLLSLATLCFVMGLACPQCVPSVTTASGTLAPAQICSGQLLFEDNFDTLNQTKWKHEISLWGGGNNEFQWYVNDRFNSFVIDGNLHLKPTFTADVFGEDFLQNGRVVIHPDECTNGKLKCVPGSVFMKMIPQVKRMAVTGKERQII